MAINWKRWIMRDQNNPKRTILSLVLAGVFVAVVFILAPPELSWPEESEEPGTVPTPTATVAALPAAPVISATEALSMMEDVLPYVLLDVRTEAEFAEGHIPGAILIPYTELYERASYGLPDRRARILVYCRSGRRSAEAAALLLSLGYTNVYDFGGIADWPYEVVGG